MRQFATILKVRTRGRGLYEFTDALVAWASAQGIETGLLTLFCRHTSASLLIQENAAPEVRVDLEAFFEPSRPRTRASTPTTTKAPTTCRPISAPL